MKAVRFEGNALTNLLDDLDYIRELHRDGNLKTLELAIGNSGLMLSIGGAFTMGRGVIVTRHAPAWEPGEREEEERRHRGWEERRAKD